MRGVVVAGDVKIRDVAIAAVGLSGGGRERAGAALLAAWRPTLISAPEAELARALGGSSSP